MRELQREPRTYELMIVLSPDVVDEALDEAVNTVSGYVTAADGEVLEVLRDAPWGRRRLAYAIRHGGRDVRDGFYAVYHFSLLPGNMQEVEREIKLNDQIMRYLLTQHAAPVIPAPSEEAAAPEEAAAETEAPATEQPPAAAEAEPVPTEAEHAQVEAEPAPTAEAPAEAAPEPAPVAAAPVEPEVETAAGEPETTAPEPAEPPVVATPAEAVAASTRDAVATTDETAPVELANQAGEVTIPADEAATSTMPGPVTETEEG